MKQCLNIKSNARGYKYIVEYTKGTKQTDNYGLQYAINTDTNTVALLTNDIKYYRQKNDWYNVKNIEEGLTKIKGLTKFTSLEEHIDNIKISSIKVHIPVHSISIYATGIKYVLSAYMRVGKYKVDLGSYVFVPTDTHASLTGPIKMGNDEYVEYVEFNIVDPFYLMYSDDWKTFREGICGETRGTNVGGTGLNISLNIINEYDNRYMLNEEYVGCATSFPISRKEDGDYLDLALNFSKDPLGFVFETNVNKAYEGDTFMDYLFETYNIGLLNDNEKPTQPIQNDQLRFQLIIKNSDTAILGPTITGGGDMKYSTLDTNGKFNKEILWSDLPDEGESSLFKKFFDSWEAFDEGWAIVGSLTIVDNTEDENEILYIVSNTIPITQEIFAMYTNGGTEYIEDVLTEEFKANIPKYNIVNKSQVIVDTLAKPVKIIDKNSTDIEKILFKFNALKKFEKLKYVTKPMLKIGK